GGRCGVDGGGGGGGGGWGGQADGTHGWRGGAGGGAYLPCDRHGRADGAARGRRDGHVYLARRQQHLRAQARTPTREKIGAMKGVFALRAYQPFPCRIYPPAAAP